MQGNLAKDLGIENQESIVFLENEKILSGASAAFAISAYLKTPFNWIKFGKYLPINFSNFCYEFIAKNRYKWFGKSDECQLPKPEDLKRVIH